MGVGLAAVPSTGSVDVQGMIADLEARARAYEADAQQCREAVETIRRLYHLSPLAGAPAPAPSPKTVEEVTPKSTAARAVTRPVKTASTPVRQGPGRPELEDKILAFLGKRQSAVNFATLHRAIGGKVWGLRMTLRALASGAAPKIVQRGTTRARMIGLPAMFAGAPPLAAAAPPALAPKFESELRAWLLRDAFTGIRSHALGDLLLLVPRDLGTVSYDTLAGIVGAMVKDGELELITQSGSRVYCRPTRPPVDPQLNLLPALERLLATGQSYATSELLRRMAASHAGLQIAVLEALLERLRTAKLIERILTEGVPIRWRRITGASLTKLPMLEAPRA